ncbi:MAG: type II secretion system GspH family protein [Selenomonadaceae bacterium]|nr:type II secretion system GspH family protein [Selenomonadaceae bacterium]
MRQKGFATLEVILMVMVIGILAAIAVPRFTSVTTAANTAKIQADLSTIDTAIAVYQMEYGSDPATVDALVNAKYLQAKPDPPTGKCYVSGAEKSIPATEYTIQAATGTTDARAILGSGNTSDKFYVPKKPN